MKILLITSKPSFAKLFLENLLAKDPDFLISNLTAAYTSYHRDLNSAFMFPRGQKYSAYPFMQEVEFYPMWRSRMARPLPQTFKRSDSGELVVDQDRHAMWKQVEDHDLVDERLAIFAREVDKVIFFNELNPSAAYTFLRLKSWMENVVARADMEVAWLKNGLTSDDIDRAIAGGANELDVEKLASSSKLKRYFDYNYLHNSFAVMQKTACEAINEPLERVPSKHELQLLYYINEAGPRSELQLLNEICNWRGTGKYASNWEIFGSPSTRGAFAANLAKNGFVTVSKDAVSITAKGKSFLSWLHKDCRDPDQAFRIDQWSSLPYEEAKAKIDRYLMSFFGRQKRFLANKIAEQSAD